MQTTISAEREILNGIISLVWGFRDLATELAVDRKSTRLNSSHSQQSRMPSSA